MITLTVKEMAAVKRIAANVLPLTNKKAKTSAKIVELGAELEKIDSQIDAQMGYVKTITNGLTTEALVIRDEKGAFQPNEAVLRFDEQKRVYIIRATEEQGVDAAAHAPAAPAEQPEASQEEVAAGMAEAAAEAEAAQAAQGAAAQEHSDGDNVGAGSPWGGQE